MSRLMAVLVACAIPAWGYAQTVDVIEYGTYVTSGDEPSPNSPPGAVVELRNVHDPRFVDRTSTIPAQLCVRFGIRFVLREPARPKRPAPTALAVTVHIEHPRLVNPDGRSSDSETWPQILFPGEPSMAGFDFDQSWEIAPGTWTISVELDGDVLASQAFTVTEMPGGGGPGDGCQHLS